MNNRYFEVNKDGYNIRAKIYYGDLKNVKQVVLFGHGFGGHMDNKAAEKFAERVISKYKGKAVVTFNLPCHGNDVRKTLTLEDCDTYISLVMEYIQEKYDSPELFVYATSFGGYLFLKYIIEHGNPFKKIALRSPAISIYRSMTDRIMNAGDYEKLQKGKEVLVGFDRKIKIGMKFLDSLRENDITKYEYFDYADDIFIIQGTADEIVSFDVVKKFAEDNVIEFLPVEGAEHRFRDPRHMEEAISTIIRFFGFS